MSEVPSPDCVFRRIVHGEQPASIVYEDEDVLTFMDLYLKPLNVDRPANDDRHSME